MKGRGLPRKAPPPPCPPCGAAAGEPSFRGTFRGHPEVTLAREGRKRAEQKRERARTRVRSALCESVRAAGPVGSPEEATASWTRRPSARRP